MISRRAVLTWGLAGAGLIAAGGAALSLQPTRLRAPRRPLQALDATGFSILAAMVDRLAKDVGFNRSHILDYTWLRANDDQIGVGKSLADITPVSGGEYAYRGEGQGKKIKTAGRFVYVSYRDAKAINPANKTDKGLSEHLTDLGVTTVVRGNDVLVPKSNVIDKSAS